MKDLVKRVLLACPGFEGLCRWLTRRHVRAVLYHRFCRHATEDPRHLDRASLEWQVAYLRAHHTAWTPDQHHDAVVGRHWPGGRCPVVVTVDDGYRDFLDVAFPVFRDAGIPVMFFVTTGFVDGANWFWWDKLAHVFTAAAPRRTDLDLSSGPVTVDLRSPSGRTAAWHEVADRGRLLPDAQKDAMVAEVAASLGTELPDAAPEPYAAVTWEELRTMVDEGLGVGAHTLSHVILARVDTERAQQEIFGSQRTLADRLGMPISWFCYPQGGPIDYTRRDRNLVAERFRGCYVAHTAPPDPDDPYTLPRYSASRDLTNFRWSLCGAEHLVARIKRRLGLRVPDVAPSAELRPETGETAADAPTVPKQRSEESP